jgi:hypothetical protein
MKRKTLAIYLLLIASFVSFSNSLSKSNYRDDPDAVLYVFNENNDESRNQREVASDVKKRTKFDSEEPTSGNVNAFSSYLKKKYGPKQKIDVKTISSVYGKEKCKGDDSRCADKTFRMCLTSSDDLGALRPSCVDKQTVRRLLKTGHVLAGNVYQGYYYDCNCDRSNLDPGIVGKQTSDEDEIMRNDPSRTKDSSSNRDGDDRKDKDDTSDRKDENDRLQPQPPHRTGDEDDANDRRPRFPPQTKNDDDDNASNDLPIDSRSNSDLTLKDLQLTLNTTCDIVKKAAGIYTVSVSIAVEDNSSVAVVIGLNPYNMNIKTRGTCDDRKSDSTATWDSALWSPTGNVNAPRWSVVKTPGDNGFSIATYTADFTINDLFECLGPNGENNLIVESDGNTLFEGTWYISKIVPINLQDAKLGELLEFDRKCAFQIHQSGKGIDTLYYRYLDKSVDISVRSLLSLCTEMGRVSFNIRTCVEKNSGNANKYLFDPVALETSAVPNGTFSISTTGNANACKIETDDTCCQDWLIQGLTEEAEPPFVGAIKILWKYGTVEDLNSDDVSDVIVTVNAYVLDDCDYYNDVIVNDTLEGQIELFSDPNFRVPYVCCSGPSILNYHRVYAALLLAINPSLCDEFVGLIVNVTLVYHKEAKDGGGILETVLIYDVNDPFLPISEFYDVIVETHPGEQCVPRISWLAIKKTEGDANVEAIIAWNATHVPFPNAYPLVENEDEIDDDKTRTASREKIGTVVDASMTTNTKTEKNESTKRWRKVYPHEINQRAYSYRTGLIPVTTSRFAPSIRAPVKNYDVSHRGTHSKKIEENLHIVRAYRHFTNKFAIYKEISYGRATLSDVKKNQLKISNVAENARFVRFRFVDKIERKNIEIACSEFSEWHEDDGECSRGGFFHWFPGAKDHPNQRGWVLALIVFFVFLFLVPFLFCICSGHPHHHRHHHLQEHHRHHHRDHHLPRRQRPPYRDYRSNYGQNENDNDNYEDDNNYKIPRRSNLVYSEPPDNKKGGFNYT